MSDRHFFFAYGEMRLLIAPPLTMLIGELPLEAHLISSPVSCNVRSKLDQTDLPSWQLLLTVVTTAVLFWCAVTSLTSLAIPSRGHKKTRELVWASPEQKSIKSWIDEVQEQRSAWVETNNNSKQKWLKKPKNSSSLLPLASHDPTDPGVGVTRP